MQRLQNQIIALCKSSVGKTLAPLSWSSRSSIGGDRIPVLDSVRVQRPEVNAGPVCLAPDMCCIIASQLLSVFSSPEAAHAKASC